MFIDNWIFALSSTTQWIHETEKTEDYQLEESNVNAYRLWQSTSVATIGKHEVRGLNIQLKAYINFRSWHAATYTPIIK
jgi:hypothetical protein